MNLPVLSTPIPNITNPAELYKQLTIDTKTPFNSHIHQVFKQEPYEFHPSRFKDHDIPLLAFLLNHLSYESLTFTKKTFEIPKQFSSLLNSLSKDLQQLTISDLELKQVSPLNEFIEKSNLRELTLTNLNLQDEQITNLGQGISSCSTLILLDLSYNKIRSGYSVGKILSVHGERRDQWQWGGQEVMGVCEINLSFNQMDDEGVRELCWFLGQDGWMRNVSLRGNLITNKGFRYIEEMLELNKNLIALDVRENKENNPESQIRQTQAILRNIKSIQKRNIDQGFDSKQFKREIMNEALNQSGLDKHQIDIIFNQELQALDQRLRKTKKKRVIQSKIEEFQNFIEEYTGRKKLSKSKIA